jgi:hypothetical protein
MAVPRTRLRPVVDAIANRDLGNGGAEGLQEGREVRSSTKSVHVIVDAGLFDPENEALRRLITLR